MAKTNFTKVEDSLKAGLEKMSISQLGQLADIAQGAKRPELKSLMEKAAKVAASTAIERRAILHIVKKTLSEIEDSNFYEALGLDKQQLQELVTRAPALKKDEWEKLKKSKEKILNLKRQQLMPASQQDETLIEKERKRHLNKRFNVREKWLPIK